MKTRMPQALLFDFDGTLTVAGLIDYAAMRSRIGCPPSASILAYVDQLTDGAERHRALVAIDEMELESAARAQAQPGADTLIRRARDRGVRLGIVTRNSRRAIDRSFRAISGISAADFGIIVTRDDELPPKPSPLGVLHACVALNVEPRETMMVGDYLYDIEAGRSAGTRTVLFDSAPERPFERSQADYRILRLSELTELLFGISTSIG